MSIITIGSTIFVLSLLFCLIEGESESDSMFNVVPSRACYDCEAKPSDNNFNGCTEEPWRTAGITLCKPWQVFCYKYNEMEFCQELNSTHIKYIRRGCSGNLLHKFCIPILMDCNSYTCYGDYCNAAVRTASSSGVLFGAVAAAIASMIFKAAHAG